MPNKYDIERLLFRRQFILGPRFVEELASWKRINVGATLCLTVHPDLNTCQVVQGNRSITLLGYVLDPDHPPANDADILARWIRELACSSLEGFFACTYGFGGRWILIVSDGNETRLFNDPMGLRQVFYTNKSYPNALWCASQPGIIAEVLNLELDQGAVAEFINSEVYKNWDECFWPGDSTPYRAITHLMPNHYLDLNTGAYYRYWPSQSLNELSLEEGVETICSLLQGLIAGAFDRFDLALAVTAGWDSRVLLAACKGSSHNVYYFSLLRRVNDPDVLVPSRLLPQLGLSHHVIRYPSRMDSEFEKLYKRNVTAAHNLWGRMAQGLYDSYPQDRVCMKGNASEIARVRFRLPEGEKVTAQKLAMFSSFTHSQEMGKNPFVIRAWKKWLSELGETHNVHLLDLFYWEHWAGNFAAMAQAEWDIVQEVFTPYNCRELLTTMLAVDERFRDHDEPILYRELIKRLWPETLSEPVNPPRSSPIGERISQVPRRLRRWGRSVRDYVRSNV